MEGVHFSMEEEGGCFSDGGSISLDGGAGGGFKNNRRMVGDALLHYGKPCLIKMYQLPKCPYSYFFSFI